MTTDTNQFTIGDWVKGKSTSGELVLGFIDDIDLKGRIVVNVVASDNENSVGKKMSKLEGIERLPESDVKTENEIMDLIDLALQVRDEQWFMDLTTKLKGFRKNSLQEEKLGKEKLWNERKQKFCSAE